MDGLEDIPEDIRKLVTLPPMRLKDYRPHIKPEDLDEEFHERDIKILLAMSTLEQKVDDMLLQQQALTNHARRREAEQIIANRAQEQISFFHGGVKWTTAIVAAGIIAAVIKQVFTWLTP